MRLRRQNGTTRLDIRVETRCLHESQDACISFWPCFFLVYQHRPCCTLHHNDGNDLDSGLSLCLDGTASIIELGAFPSCKKFAGACNGKFIWPAWYIMLLVYFIVAILVLKAMMLRWHAQNGTRLGHNSRTRDVQMRYIWGAAARIFASCF